MRIQAEVHIEDVVKAVVLYNQFPGPNLILIEQF